MSEGVYAAAPPHDSLAIEDVTVLDPASATATPHQTVVVERGRITQVAPSAGSRPSVEHRVDGTGRFVLPGLWDMHVHVFPRPERAFFPLFIGVGITGIRDMSRPMELIHTWRADIAAGRTPGPRMVGCGGIVDGPRSRRPYKEMIVRNASEARGLVGSLVEAGSDFIKIYGSLSRESYYALLEEARRRLRTVCGHMPVVIPVAEASEVGQRSVEHLEGFLLAASAEEDALRPRLIEAYDMIAQPMPDSFYPEETAAEHLRRLGEVTQGYRSSGFTQTMRDAGGRAAETRSPEKSAALFDRFVRNDTWQCPTLYAHALAGSNTVFESDADDLRYLASSLHRPPSPHPGYYMERTTDANRAVVGEMSRAGVPLLAGSDVGPYPNMIPAVALHDELRLLVRCGLSAAEALAAATSAPARFLGQTDNLGRVESGKLGDLLLLDADPFEDIANTRRIHAVVANGRLFDRAALDRLLDGVAENAERM